MREVVWGDDPKPRRIRQKARVVDAGALTRLLFAALDEREMTSDAKPARAARWQVNSEAGASRLLRTGERAMMTARVDLVRPLDPPRREVVPEIRTMG